MMYRALCISAFVLGVIAPCGVSADEVVLKDGSWIVGEIIQLVGGKLKVKTVFAKEIEIDWEQVSVITTEKPIKVVLKELDDQGEKQTISGRAVRMDDGSIALQTKELEQPVPLDRTKVFAINPPVKPFLSMKGYVTLGGSINDGNTNTKAFNATGEWIGTMDIHRFTIRGTYNYAEDSDRVTARNALGTVKYDVFVYKRLYVFASALFEGDRFQDLDLRTALSAGAGYQFIEAGDFDSPWLEDLEFSGEAGLSYFFENYKDVPNRSYSAARWMIRILWPVLQKKIIFFHNHEGYPSLEDHDNFYFVTETGLRCSIIKNFFANFQINWRYTNSPPAGVKRTDTMFIVGVGFNFDQAFE